MSLLGHPRAIGSDDGSRGGTMEGRIERWHKEMKRYSDL